MRFGPAGYPPGSKSPKDAMDTIVSLGLDALEVEFVRGVRVSEESARANGRLAAERDLPVQSHLSENQAEMAWVRQLHPDCQQYWETYAKYGLWNDRTVMAHCVWSDVRERQAMGDAPIQRMGTAIVPMDDALVMSSLDLVDRPYADVDLPDPIYTHYMRSLAMSAGMTIHIVVIRGFDEHHIVEAAFKATGKALAAALSPRGTELSTKDREVIG